MPKVVFEISKEGHVELRGEGFEKDACMRSEKLQKLLRTIKQEGEIDKETRLYQDQKEVLSYEELI